MKTRILTIGLSLVTVLAFAQKKEIRNAENAVEDGNYTEAKTLLKSVESLIAEESDSRKTDYYLVKAQAFLGAENGKNASLEDLTTAAKAYKKVVELGKEKEVAIAGITAVKNALINSAIADQKTQDYAAASDKLYQSYQLNKKDTIYLYYAASNSVQAQDYDQALDYYNKLMEMGYSGAKTQYMATEKASGETVSFSSKDQRDLFVKTGNYTDPQTKEIPSKTGEIAKNIAMIYIQQKKPELAEGALKEALKNNPDDMQLLLAQANLYYELGKIDIYNKMMKEIVKKDPENARLYYNLGVSSAQLGDVEGAKEYYKKAIELDPKNANSYLNLSMLIMGGEGTILKEMNKALEEGNTAKYDELSKKRKALYSKALPYLEKAQEIKPDGVEVTRTLMNIYYILEQPEKAKNMKTKLDSLTQ